MRIDNLSPILARTLLEALPKAAPGFAVGTEEAMAPKMPVQGPGTAHPVPTVEMLVTLAATDPAVERRRKLARDADRGLEALDRLHKAVLAGVPSVERLREIVEWSENLETPDEPVLAQILKDIDLRVRVELAKYDVQA